MVKKILSSKTTAIATLIVYIFILKMETALAQPPPLELGFDAVSVQYFSATLAFGTAAIAAGWAVGKVGSAGLASAAERPEAKTTAVILTALGEALAIYGLVVSILILSIG